MAQEKCTSAQLPWCQTSHFLSTSSCCKASHNKNNFKKSLCFKSYPLSSTHLKIFPAFFSVIRVINWVKESQNTERPICKTRSRSKPLWKYLKKSPNFKHAQGLNKLNHLGKKNPKTNQKVFFPGQVHSRRTAALAYFWCPWNKGNTILLWCPWNKANTSENCPVISAALAKALL